MLMLISCVCLGVFAEEAGQAALLLSIWNLLFYSHLSCLVLMLASVAVTNSERTLSATVDMLRPARLLSRQLLGLPLSLKDASAWPLQSSVRTASKY